ncbi:hypothetical protein NE237_030562 [Protea cynaroides]|uniref:Uncharacterized protein n=1 Tax=Protea cynaroides TaxID=273540 RepID=A0A9Q0GUG9_9MAGN|nr:hypothetical protein NE237_030562 [Protea cynaroides]
MAANNGEPAGISNLNLRSCNFSIGERFESEIPDSSYSLSLPSEPPDIRNWFSSYQYESPALETGDGFSSGESQSKDRGLEDISRIKKDDLGQFKIISVRDVSRGRNSLNAFDGCQRFGNYDNQENQCLNKDNHLVCRKSCADESLEGKQEQSHDFIPLKDDEELYLNGRNALAELDAIEENTFSSLKTSRRSPEELLVKRIAEEKILETKVPATQVDQTLPANGASINRSTRSSDDKENDGKVFASDGGFISTRKNRIIKATDGKFPGRNRAIEENLRNESMSSRIDGKSVGVVRKALSERTNIQCEPIAEIAGKWRYPRKNKLDLGPPLKQLRLEQWVHRV